MNRFEKRPKTTIAVLLIVVLVLLVSASEWLLTLDQDKTVIRGGDSLPNPQRHLALREWSPWSVFEFAPPDTRRTDAAESIPETYILETDHDGFIEPGRVHTEPDRVIAFFGGSTTECLYVTPEQRFPFRAGRLLEDRLDIRINTLNAAKSGGNTMHAMLTLMGKVLPLKPDVAVLMQNTNDLAVLSRPGGYWTDHSDFALLRTRRRDLETVVKDLRDMTIPQSYRAFRRVMRDGLWNTAQAADASAAAVAPESATMEQRGASFESALRSFVAVAKAWNIQPVLMTQAQIGSQGGGGPDAVGDYLAEARLQRHGFTAKDFDSAHAYFNAIVRHVALSEQILLIDLADRPWTREDLYDGLHFTDRGSQTAAELIAKALHDALQNSQHLEGQEPD